MRSFWGIFHVAMITFQLDPGDIIFKVKFPPIWISNLIFWRLVDSPGSSWMTSNMFLTSYGHPGRSWTIHEPPENEI